MIKILKGFLLHLRLYIDKHIPAYDEIQAGKGGVLKEIVPGKYNHFPDLFVYHISVCCIIKIFPDNLLV